MKQHVDMLVIVCTTQSDGRVDVRTYFLETALLKFGIGLVCQLQWKTLRKFKCFVECADVSWCVNFYCSVNFQCQRPWHFSWFYQVFEINRRMLLIIPK